jgi:hypothetical protein
VIGTLPGSQIAANTDDPESAFYAILEKQISAPELQLFEILSDFGGRSGFAGHSRTDIAERLGANHSKPMCVAVRHIQGEDVR